MTWSWEKGWRVWHGPAQNRQIFWGTTSVSLGNMRSPLIFKRALKKADLPAAAWSGGVQVHGRQVRQVRQKDAGHLFPKTDGVITALPGMALRVLTADCVPVFLWDPEAPAIAMVHAGWRGVAKNILGRAIDIFTKKWHTNPARLWMGLGPHIRSCCYEVGSEVTRHFEAVPKSVRQKKETQSLFLDMAVCLRHQARSHGLLSRRIIDAGDCTHHDKRYFSFRRNGTDQRIASVAWLKP